MARYIDVEKVNLKGIAVFDENLDVLIPMSVVRKALQMTPTADVVPKSEVDSLKAELEDRVYTINSLGEYLEKSRSEVERLRKALDEYEETSGLKQAKAEVTREIFEDIDNKIGFGHDVIDIFDILDELKKKYMEGKP